MGQGTEPIKLQIEELLPTQITVGLREVATKEKEFENESKDERHDYLKAHRVPVVMGPGGRHHIVDHHHLVRALWQAGFHSAWCYVMSDQSKLTEAAFWTEMEKQAWVYPFDEHNHRRPFSEIPLHVEGLRDDPYRSLAGFVRRLGGFVKDEGKPFVEFAWANFFREKIPLPPGDEAFKHALQTALQISHTAAAKDLPGYVRAAVTAKSS